MRPNRKRILFSGLSLLLAMEANLTAMHVIITSRKRIWQACMIAASRPTPLVVAAA